MSKPRATFRLAATSLILGVAVLVMLIGTAAWSLTAWLDYRVTLTRAAASADDAARLLEEHIRRTVTGSDLVVQRVAASLGTGGPGQLGTRPAERERLRLLAEMLPERGSLWLVDGEGQLVLSSAEPDRDPPSLRGPIWQAHRDGSVLNIAGLHANPATGQWQFCVSRRLADGEGAFAGIVVAAISVETFTEFHKSLGLGPKSSVTVSKEDGTILLRQPANDAAIGGSLKGSPLFHAVQRTDSGSLRAISPIDGIERLVSYRRVTGLPLVVSASVAVEDVLAAWRDRLFHSAAFAFAALAAVLTLSLLALRSIKRERQARLALEAANAGLEQRVRDRTDALEQANQRLTTALAETESARSEAELANQAKSRFLAAASHDLRQPLQALHLFLDALSFRLTEPKNCQLVDKAIQALEGGESLLNALLDISTLEAGTVEPEVRDFRVWVLLDQLTQEFDSQALKKGLVLHMVPSSLMIRSDPVLLARIVRNLMSNALRHSRRGRILLGVRRIAGGARIEVWDTGPGIPPDKLQVIFEDFYQLDNPERDRTKGLGIGLSIVERTAHLLGHGVAVRSILGKGSMFAITVPLAAEDDDADMVPVVPALQEG